MIVLIYNSINSTTRITSLIVLSIYVFICIYELYSMIELELKRITYIHPTQRCNGVGALHDLNWPRL